MSIEHMTLVWKHSKKGGTALLLLLAIADFANDDGVAWPSLATLAHRIRMTERYTYLALTKLIRANELKRLTVGGGRRSTTYKIVIRRPLRRASGVNPASGVRRDSGLRPASGQPRGGPQGIHHRSTRSSPKGDESSRALKARANKAPLGDAGQKFFKQFPNALTAANRNAMLELQADVGPDVLQAVVAWAIKRKVSQVSRLATAARGWKLKPAAGQSQSSLQSPVVEWRRRRKEKK